MAEFEPKYQITNTIVNNLLEIERVKEGIKTMCFKWRHYPI